MSDTTLYEVECVVLATLIVSFTLALVVRRLQRTRSSLDLRAPVAAGVLARLLVIAGVGLSGLELTLRGGDERTFLQGAHEVAGSPLGSGAWSPTDSHRLHEIVFALQIRFGDFPEAAMRVMQVGLAMLGIVLVAAAVCDLAGPRAARLAAWALALEPASIFFNSMLHREPLLTLAGGLVVFGGAKVWSKLDLGGIALLGMGCLIALGTRPYAGWFLITAALLLILHASMRQVDRRLRSVPLVYSVVIVAAMATPAVLQLTSERSLERNLQSSQDANSDPTSVRGQANSNNLSLEQVDFSSRSDVISNLPRRIRDLVARPYPWQVNNVSQRLGAIGTLVSLGVLYLLLRYGRRNRARVVALTAPVLYPLLFLLIAYALSVGNAGTGFRYRTHLVMLGVAMLAVLREHALARASTAQVDMESAAEPQAARVGRGRRALPVEGV